MALMLIHTAADGTVTKTNLLTTSLIASVQGHYAIVDDVTGEPAMQLRLTRAGDNLVVENLSAEGDQTLVSLEEFFAENAQSTFAVDGSEQAAQTTEGYLISSSTETAAIADDGQSALVWESSDINDATNEVASTSDFNMPLAFLGVVSAGALLIANDSSDSSDVEAEAAPVVAELEANVEGFVADGYIEGAQIYADANGNGIAENSELIEGVLTDAQGQFSLPAEYADIALLAVGGTNTDTGLANTLTLGSPAGTYIINPLTTVLQAYISENPDATAAEADSAVQEALGIELPEGQTLSTYDPIAEDNVEVQAVAAQIVEIAAEAESTSEGSGSDVFDNLADAIDDANTADAPLDLADSSVVADAFEGIEGIDEETIAAIATQNAAIDEAESIEGISSQQEAPIVSLTDDTGSSQSDLITRVGTLDVTAKQEGGTIEYSIDAGTTWTTTFTAAEGVNDVQVREMGTDGEASGVSEISFTYDVSGPAVSVEAITIKNSENVSVQSSEVGTAYLVSSTATVTSVAEIEALSDDSYNSVTITTADTDTDVSALGLAVGDYVLYAADAAGNLSVVSGESVTVDNADPSIVVFDLVNGVSSSHSDRMFDADVSYTIYLMVDSDSTAVQMDSESLWAGSNNLGSDDTVILVGDNGPVMGKNNEVQGSTIVSGGYVNLWITEPFVNTAPPGIAAVFTRNGIVDLGSQLSRTQSTGTQSISINSVAYATFIFTHGTFSSTSPFTGSVGPSGRPTASASTQNSDLMFGYSASIPVGVMTTQGLV